MQSVLKTTVRGMVLIGLLVLITSGCAIARDPGADRAESSRANDSVEPVYLLCIGNSFSHDATAHLRQIVEAAGREIVIQHASLGGCSLERHWRHAAAFQANPDDPEGRPYGPSTNRFSLRERLTSREWDFVTIQQASGLSFRPETYQPFAGLLADYVRTHAPTAELLVHQTWAWGADDPLFASDEMTQQQMYERSRAAYVATAQELGARLLPVGDAMQRARQSPHWGVGPRDPDYDYANPVEPNLPRQPGRLTVGYVWRGPKDSRRLVLDAHHASLAGRYLAAAVWFETLFSTSVIGNSYVPDGLTVGQVRDLQEIAHATVAAMRQADQPDNTPAPAAP